MEGVPFRFREQGNLSSSITTVSRMLFFWDASSRLSLSNTRNRLYLKRSDGDSSYTIHTVRKLWSSPTRFLMSSVRVTQSCESAIGSCMIFWMGLRLDYVLQVFERDSEIITINGRNRRPICQRNEGDARGVSGAPSETREGASLGLRQSCES